MRFTAFDFETCNGRDLSAVALGVAVFIHSDSWRLAETRSWRFSPIDDEFWDRCSKINRIYREDVEGLPNFASIWPHVEPYFRDTLLVAHNAPFDIKAMCSHLDHHGIERPNSHACCTMALADRHLRCAERKLPEICKLLRIPLPAHHDPVCDAVAAGRVYAFLHARHRGQSSDRGISIRDWTPTERTAPSASVWEEWDDEFVVDISEPDRIGDFEETLRLCKTQLLDGWAFSITGDLAIDRKKIIELLRSVGARCGDKGEFYKRPTHPQGPTNALVISETELSDVLNQKRPTKKLQQAIAARNDGCPMVVIPEDRLYEVIIDADLAEIPRDGFKECETAKLLWESLAACS